MILQTYGAIEDDDDHDDDDDDDDSDACVAVALHTFNTPLLKTTRAFISPVCTCPSAYLAII